MSCRPRRRTWFTQEDLDCPLCLEEIDLSDANFKPCPCGYQVRFCSPWCRSGAAHFANKGAILLILFTPFIGHILDHQMRCPLWCRYSWYKLTYQFHMLIAITLLPFIFCLTYGMAFTAFLFVCLIFCNTLQICRFCWHHIKQNLNGRCPACRRKYSDNTVEFKAMSQDEWVGTKRID